MTTPAPPSTPVTRFHRAAWAKTQWERSDRDRPEAFDIWQAWCQQHAVDDIDQMVAAVTRIAELAPLHTFPAGDYVQRDGTRVTMPEQTRCSSCHQVWPREVTVETETCAGCLVRKVVA